MPAPHEENRQYLIRQWMPAIIFGSFLAILIIAALMSRDPGRVIPAIGGLVLFVVVFFGMRWSTASQMARLIRSPDPTQYVRHIMRTSARGRIAHVEQMAAAACATFYALHARFDDAERALESVSWRGVPPLIEAQRDAARAVLEYSRGNINEGLDHAVAAGQLATVDAAVPGAATSELAFRTYRNLGLALAGRATAAAGDELRLASMKLPQLGRILATWGLAAMAKHQGDQQELKRLRSAIATQAPYFNAVLNSIA